MARAFSSHGIEAQVLPMRTRPIRSRMADITDANTRRSAGGILPAAAGAFGCHAGNLAGRNGNNGFIRICTDGEINAVVKPK